MCDELVVFMFLCVGEDGGLSDAEIIFLYGDVNTQGKCIVLVDKDCSKQQEQQQQRVLFEVTPTHRRENPHNFGFNIFLIFLNFFLNLEFLEMKRDRENSENESEESKSKKVSKSKKEYSQKKVNEQFSDLCALGKVEDVQSALQNVDADFEVEGLFHAIEYERLEIVELLLENGVTMNETMDYVHEITYEDYTVLHVAAHGGHVDIAKVLIRNGADVNAVDKDKKTALHVAAWNGHGGYSVEVAKVLLENGADVNAIDQWKRTALHIVAECGLVDAAKVLIQNGADVNALERNGLSPFM